MTAYLIPTTQQFFDNNGDPLAGGMIYTCIAGASGYTEDYFKDTYTDATGAVTNPNPIILDAFGRCNMWGDGNNYKLLIFNSSGTLIRSDDNVSCILGVDPTITIQVSDNSITTAKLVDGGVTTAKLADGSVTYPKINPAVSAAPSDVTTGTSTTQFITPYALSQAGITPGGGTAAITSRIGSTGNTANRNMLDNTDFNIAQRGTSISITPNAIVSMTLDRWYSVNSGGASASTTSRDTMTINGVPRGCLKFTSGNAQATIPASSIIYPAFQVIEGYTLYPRVKAGDSVTIGVWMEVSVAGKYAIALRNANDTYSYVHTVTLAANTPTEVIFTVQIPATAGLWNCPNSNLIGASIMFGPISGATYQTASPDTWVSGNYLTTAECVNYAATAGATIKIARPRMEEGTSLGVYESRPYSEDLARARYFLPAWSGQYTPLGVATASSATAAFLSIPFTHQTRIAPTGITLSAASHISVLLPSSLSISPTSVAFNAASTFGLLAMNLTGLSGLTAGYAYHVYGNTSAFYLLATGAEL